MADLYSQFWQRKQLATEAPKFPVVRWWNTDGLCQIESIYFDAIRNAASLLDVGAGDLRIRRKFQAAGFTGLYETLDSGTEHRHTYASLDSVARMFDAIVCLDVIEHMPLHDGLQMLERMTAMLTPGGVLIVQTPNARCIRNPLGWDMTHIHCYNARDLWSYLTQLGYAVTGYRIELSQPRLSPVASLKSMLSKAVITRLLGCDYADNLGFIAQKNAPQNQSEKPVEKRG